MSWSEKTWYAGGGDTMHQDKRYYRYRFSNEPWYMVFKPYQVSMTLPFETSELNTNGDSMGHQSVLVNPDFKVRNMNVMDWARDTIKNGRVDFLFEIDAGDPFVINQKTKCNLKARFSDKGIASLFKLTFGGR